MPAGMQVTVALVKKTTGSTAWTSVGAQANAALAGFPIRGMTLGQPVGELLVDDTFGNAQPKDADAGNINLAGDLNGFGRYDALTIPFALFMGIAGAPTVSGTGFTHLLKWANSIDQLAATMVLGVTQDGALVIDEFPSLKFAGFVLRQVTGQAAELTFNVIANTRRYSTDSTDLPFNTTQGSVTTISPRYRLMGHHLKVRGNLQGAGALTSPTDDLTPREIVLTVNRQMVGDFVFNGSRIIDEPELDNVPTATLQMNWPVHRTQTDVLMRAAKNDVEYKFDITWTHPAANTFGTSLPYTFRVDIPRGRIGSPDRPMTGPGRIPYSQTVQLLKPEAAPTGMSGLTDMLQIFMRNTFATNPLA